MTAARRGQKAAFPNCDFHRRETSPVGPYGQRQARPRPSPPAPRMCYLTCASTPSARVTGHDAIHPHTASSGTRSGLPAFSKLHHSRPCSFRFGRPQDDIAVILAGSAQGLELVNVGLLDIDDEAASLVTLRRRFVCALRKARFDCCVSGRGDGNADHGSHPTTTEWLRAETSKGHVLTRRGGPHGS